MTKKDLIQLIVDGRDAYDSSYFRHTGKYIDPTNGTAQIPTANNYARCQYEGFVALQNIIDELPIDNHRGV